MARLAGAFAHAAARVLGLPPPARRGRPRSGCCRSLLPPRATTSPAFTLELGSTDVERRRWPISRCSSSRRRGRSWLRGGGAPPRPAPGSGSPRGALLAWSRLDALAARAPTATPSRSISSPRSKFVEYAAARSRRAAARSRRAATCCSVLAALVAWGAVAGGRRAAAVRRLGRPRRVAAGRRQPSFLGHHEFAALAGASLSPRRSPAILVGRRGTAVVARGGRCLAAGGVGLVLSGAIVGALGSVAGDGRRRGRRRRGRIASSRRAWLALGRRRRRRAGRLARPPRRGPRPVPALRRHHRASESTHGGRRRRIRSERCSSTSDCASSATTRWPGSAGRRSSESAGTSRTWRTRARRFPDVADVAFPSRSTGGASRTPTCRRSPTWVRSVARPRWLVLAGLFLAWRRGHAASAGLAWPGLVALCAARHARRRSGPPRACRRVPARALRRGSRSGRRRRRGGPVEEHGWLTRGSTRRSRRRRTPCAGRSSGGWRRGAPSARGPRPQRVLDVGCGLKPYYPYFAPYAAEYVGVDRSTKPRGRPPGARRGAPGRGRRASTSSFASRCSSTRRSCARRDGAASGDGAGRARAGLDARRDGLPPLPGRTTGVGRRRGWSGCSAANGDWASVRVTPASGTTACLAMIALPLPRHRRRELVSARLTRPLVAA